MFVCLRSTVLGDRTRLAVCVTLHDEEGAALRRTLHALSVSIARVGVPVEEIAICVVVDGRAAMSASALHLLDRLGVVDPGAFDAPDVEAPSAAAAAAPVCVHVFENPVVRMADRVVGGEDLPMMVVVKEQPSGVAASHRWFFDGLCRRVEPDWCVLLSAGTAPAPDALQQLISEMEVFDDVGGCCGELRVRGAGSCGSAVRRVQAWSRKLAHVLTLPSDAALGIGLSDSMMSAAFAAYRYRALAGRPLEAYYRWCSRVADDGGAVVDAAPRYAAAGERVLAFEVVAHEDCRWRLSYVPSAAAATGAPASVGALLEERRASSAGSRAALAYAMCAWPRLMTYAAHAASRKFALVLSLSALLVATALEAVAPASAFVAVRAAVSVGLPMILPAGSDAADAAPVALACYASLLLLQLGYASTAPATRTPRLYAALAALHFLAMAGVVAAGAAHGAGQLDAALAAPTDFLRWFAAAAAAASPLLAALCMCDARWLLASAPHALAFLPTLAVVAPLHSFARAGAGAGAGAEGRGAHGVGAWVAVNLALVFAATLLPGFGGRALHALAYGYGGLFSFRLVVAMAHRVHSCFARCCCAPRKPLPVDGADGTAMVHSSSVAQKPYRP